MSPPTSPSPKSRPPIKPIILHASAINLKPAETFQDTAMGGNVSWKTLISAPQTQSNTFTVGLATCAAATTAAAACLALACVRPSPSLSPDSTNSTITTTTTTTTTSPPSCSSPGGGHLKLHRHAHAEIYHVTSGRGIVTIDGVEHEVRKGSVVFIPGDAEHGIRNIGGASEEEGDLSWLYVFAADGFGEVLYRFSGSGSGGEKARL